MKRYSFWMTLNLVANSNQLHCIHIPEGAERNSKFPLKMKKTLWILTLSKNFTYFVFSVWWKIVYFVFSFEVPFLCCDAAALAVYEKAKQAKVESNQRLSWRDLKEFWSTKSFTKLKLWITFDFDGKQTQKL